MCAGWSASFDRVCGRFLGAREAIEQTPQQEDCQAQWHSIQKLRANVFVSYLAACRLVVSEQMMAGSSMWRDNSSGHIMTCMIWFVARAHHTHTRKNVHTTLGKLTCVVDGLWCTLVDELLYSLADGVWCSLVDGLWCTLVDGMLCRIPLSFSPTQATTGRTQFCCI